MEASHTRIVVSCPPDTMRPAGSVATDDTPSVWPRRTSSAGPPVRVSHVRTVPSSEPREGGKEGRREGGREGGTDGLPAPVHGVRATHPTAELGNPKRHPHHSP